MRIKTKFFIATIIAMALVAGGYFVYARIQGLNYGENNPYSETNAVQKRSVPVVLTPSCVREFKKLLVVQGNVEAQRIAMVPSRVAATIESIFVDEGDYVVKGETKLFQIDALKLQKAVEIGRQALEVAHCALVEKKANLERVEADLYKIKIDHERFQKLLEDGIVSTDEFERIESRYKQTIALQKHARTLVDLAAEERRQAKAALEIAEKDLRDALVYAPISGKISQRFQEPGEMGDTNKPVLRIEDPSVVEVSAFLSGQYYQLIQPGETNMNIRVYSISLKDQIISYRSPTIDSKLRTFEIKCVLKDPPDGVVPGAMAEIEVFLERHKGLGVPNVAIQERAGRTVVFLVEDDVAHMVEVKTGIETDGWTEVTGLTLKENDPVVTMGQFLLEENTKVIVQKG